MSEQKPCNEHPNAPHGFMRNASHEAGHYVCECHFWNPEEDYHSDKDYEVGTLEDCIAFDEKRNMRYTITVEEDTETGDLVLPFTDDIIEQVGWKIGDTIDWKDNHDGSFTLTKVEKKVWVMVDTIFTYRMRYCVEAPAAHPEYALDDVTMETAREFSQLPLGEQITSHRVVTEEEALAMCDVDNDYCKAWSTEHKIDTFFTKEGEKVQL